MPLARSCIAADARFWPQAAREVLRFAAGSGVPPRRLEALTWLVPSGAQATLARRALRAELGAAPFLPPRIAPLAAWLGRPLRSGVAARAELFTALRDSAWIREAFGDRPSPLWALAASVAELADELTLAAAGDGEAFAGRLQASLARHYRRRAARAVQPQAQLVLQLWRARRSADDGAAAALRALQAKAETVSSPLVFLAGVAPATAIDGWLLAFLQRCAQRVPVLLIEADLRGALAERPLLAAAWPELAGDDTPAPIAQRAASLQATDTSPLTLLSAASLEEEAGAVARQVLQWRSSGVESIALVALDRLTARRARALLERAQVIVRDETGWKLSTTSAAAAVMRWYDLVADDLYWRDLLDWLKSGFTLAGRPNKAQEIELIERAIRAGGALQGARAMRSALADFAGRDADEAAAAAGEVLALIVGQRQAALRAGPTLAAHLRALNAGLDALGMRAPLAADPVGRCVLAEIDALAAELAAATAPASLEEFRALLAARFEEAAFVDAQVDSPVVMLSLAAAVLRPFEAALLIGADARHLPRAGDDLLFVPDAVRAELGLSTAETSLRGQAAQLAALLATVPRVTALWRRQRGDEPNALSPLLQRLAAVASRAAGAGVVLVEPETIEVEPRPVARPAPAAAQLLPQRLSASDAQALVDCPYRFYARRLLQLAEPEDIIEVPDKRDFGLALHAVLRRFHEEWGDAAFDAIDRQSLAAGLRRHAAAVFAPLTERAPAMLAFHRRFDGLVDGYVDWLRGHAAQGWRWLAGEQRLEQPLPLDGQRVLALHGRVDRIDRDDDRQIVIDYKARTADRLRAALKSPGEDIQLPFYGLLLARRAEAAAYVSFDRAREDDSGVATVAPPQPFAALVDAVGERLRDDLRRIAQAAPLPAIGASAICDTCEMRGLCRRDHWERGDADEG